MLDAEMSTATSEATAPGPADPFRPLQRRLSRLRWLVPAGLLVVVVVNELGLARWIHLRWGDVASITWDIVVYGSVGPVMAYLALTFIGRWLEERETSELQAQVLHQAQAQAQRTHDLTDDALQTLFATSLVLDNLAEQLPNSSPEAAAQFHAAGQAVNRAIEQLYVTQKQTKN